MATYKIRKVSSQLAVGSSQKERAVSPRPARAASPTANRQLPTANLKLKCGILTPGLGLGGAERWIVDMVTRVPVEWRGVATLNVAGNDPENIINIEKVCPIYERAARVHELIEQCDVCLVWGIEDSARFFEDTNCHRIVVAQGTTYNQHSVASCADATSAAGCVAVSEYARETFPEEERERVQVIVTGTDPARCRVAMPRYDLRFIWGVPQSAKVLGYLGRMVGNKWPRGLLEAIAALPDEWHGVLAGVGPQMETLRGWAKELNVLDRVHFVGAQYDVGSALAAFDWSYFCSDAESWGLVFVESWMAGVPVVGTNVGAAARHPDFVAGVPVRADGESIARTILASDGTPQTAARIAHAREYALLHYTTEQFVAQWLEYLSRFDAPARSDKSIRFGVFMPVCYRGGAEQSTLNLVRNVGSDGIEYAGCAVLRPGQWDAGARREFEAAGAFYEGEDGARELARGCDVVMSWGIPDPQRFTTGTECRIIQASRGNDSDFTRTAMRGCESAAAIVAVSPSSVEGVPAAQRARTVVIPNMVNTERLQPTQSRESTLHELGIAPAQRVIGFVGRLDDNKRPLLLMEAMRHLGPQWTALVVGDGPQRTRVETAKSDRIVSDRISDRIVYAGVRRDIGNVYAALECLVVPSRNEGFCNVMAEAWLARVPVIATRVGMATERPDLICEIPFDADAVDVANAIRGDARRFAQRKKRVQTAFDYAQSTLTKDVFIRKWREVITMCNGKSKPETNEYDDVAAAMQEANDPARIAEMNDLGLPAPAWLEQRENAASDDDDDTVARGSAFPGDAP